MTGIKKLAGVTLAGLVGGLSILAVWVWIGLRPPPPLRAAPVPELEDVTLVNPGVGRRPGVTIRVLGDAISAISDFTPHPGRLSPARWSGCFVLPGLVDMHSHLPPRTGLELTEFFAFLYLAHGVTTIREVGDTDGTAVEAARRGMAEGRFPGPRVFACGPFVSGGPPRWANSLILKDPAQADAIVARIQEAGFDCVKAYDDLSLEAIEALKTVCRRRGIPLLGHVPTALAYEEALIPEVQHLLGVPPPTSLGRDHVFNRVSRWGEVDEDRLRQIVEITLRHDIINTPTLVLSHQILRYRDYPAALRDPAVGLLPRFYPEVVWNPVSGLAIYRDLPAQGLQELEDALEKKKELVRRLDQAGAKLLIGTDVQQPFVVPGASLHQEMRLFAEAGVPVERVWEIATRGASARLGAGRLGFLEAGAPADFLLFRKDPTADLSALDSLEAVVSQGRLFTRAQIEAQQIRYQTHFQGFVFKTVSHVAARRAMEQTLKRDY